MLTFLNHLIFIETNYWNTPGTNFLEVQEPAGAPIVSTDVYSEDCVWKKEKKKRTNERKKRTYIYRCDLKGSRHILNNDAYHSMITR